MLAALANGGDMRLGAFYSESFAVNALDGRLGTTPGNEGQTFGITENLVQIAHRAPVRIALVSKPGTICNAAANFFSELVWFFTQQDGVAVRLGHLASIQAKKLGSFCEQGLRLFYQKIFY